MTGTAGSARPYVVHPGAGERTEFLGHTFTFKAGASDTAGAFSAIEIVQRRGGEPPLHVHHREDEAFYVLDGEVTLFVGDEIVQARTGDCAFGPRDVPHRYEVGPNGCRMLFICTPGGFERLVEAMSEPADALTLPPEADAPIDVERIGRIAREHGCEVLA
jgi:mannose-6-phosphate isomerase-like protein (cupin superfamily)